ncbi:MAG: class I SAM-dependent methyltransferase [Pedobacter sp.]|jgi:hypothetical protein|uniref:class I SAM-dependent methyltransferase n=1 Tax=Pedobacter sp. TaxID=1411316 RepID=UPI0035625AD5
MQSKVTGGATIVLFKVKILNKYEITYFKCVETGFIQTEEPYWLEEAYSSAITKLDIGLVYRNENLRGKLLKILSKHFDKNGKYLDYAGGYGLFTRLMRDQGYDFYHTDIYCKNIFAEYFDLSNLPSNTKFELLTAFEVFEHLPNPLTEIEAMMKHSDSIFFSTELVPQMPLNSSDDWWYFIPETGQHLAFYTEKSLAFIAEKFGFNFYTDGASIHLFTKKTFSEDPFKIKRDPFLIRKMRKMVKKFDQKQYPSYTSLLNADWEMVKEKLK